MWSDVRVQHDFACVIYDCQASQSHAGGGVDELAIESEDWQGGTVGGTARYQAAGQEADARVQSFGRCVLARESVMAASSVERRLL